MEEMLNQLTQWIQLMSGGSPIVQTALFSIFTVAVSGFLGVMLIKLPKQIKNFFWDQCTVTTSVDTSGYLNTELFAKISAGLYEKSNDFGSRVYSIEVTHERTKNRSWKSVNNLGLGYGTHVLWMGYRVFFIKLVMAEKGTKLTKIMHIRTLGRSKKPLVEFLNSFEEKEVFVPGHYSLVEKDWQRKKDLEKPFTFEQLCLSDDTRSFMTDRLDYFVNNRDEFKILGLPHKVTFMLYGEPGTGKTSIISALALKYGFNLAEVNLSSMNDSTLINLFSTLPKRSFVIMEDIDCTGTVNKRTEEVGGEGKVDPYGCTLHGILNVLDGINTLDEVVIFMTTNKINKIDPALLRPGRTDASLEVPLLSPDVTNSYLNELYGVDDFNVLRDLRACDLTQIKEIAKLDVDKAKEALLLIEKQNSKLRNVA